MIDPKVAARDLVLNSERASRLLTKTLDLTDAEHTELDRIENEVTELRHFVRKQLLDHFGVTADELMGVL